MNNIAVESKQKLKIEIVKHTDLKVQVGFGEHNQHYLAVLCCNSKEKLDETLNIVKELLTFVG